MQRRISFEVIHIIKYIINEKIYKHNTGKIFSFTKQPLEELLGPVPSTVPNILFLNYKHFMCCGWIFPECDTVFYQGMTISEIYNI